MVWFWSFTPQFNSVQGGHLNFILDRCVGPIPPLLSPQTVENQARPQIIQWPGITPRGTTELFADLNALTSTCCAFALAAAVTFVTNRLALIPWRQNRDSHWTEQARLLFPVRRAASASLWCLPGIIVLLTVLLRPNSNLWIFASLGAAIGAAVGNLPLDHEIFPWIPQKTLWRWTAINGISRLLIWTALIGVILWMPDRFGWRAIAMGGGIIILWLLWTSEGVIWVWRTLGILKAAPARLLGIVTETSARMGIPFREVLVLDAPLPQAYANPTTGRLFFTERITEVSPDDELGAICAHELAHLGEPWTARYSRYIRVLPLLPWMFFKPLSSVLSPGGALIATALTSIITSHIFKRISRKLESRADGIAKANENDTGVYARALTRMYMHNLIPAVHAELTHPSLYDRVLAAGITPDYPRPKCARNMAWHGTLFLCTVGALFGCVLVRLLVRIVFPNF
jgi:Zn-dependent protease with chaperone function